MLKVRPEDCVALEDAGDGVIAAAAAGMKVIAVPNKYTRVHDFDIADLVVDSLTQINWEIIKKL